jgi:hypothetical protein
MIGSTTVTLDFYLDAVFVRVCFISFNSVCLANPREANETQFVLVLLVILVAATFGVGYLAGSGSSGSRTATKTAISTTATTTKTVENVVTIATSGAASSKSAAAGNATSSSSMPINGIRLATSINTTNLSPGQALNVTLSISNVLGTINDLRTASDWPFQGIPVDFWPLPYNTFPAQVVVLNGNYSADSLSLLLRAKFQSTCIECVTLDHVVLEPNGDLANVTGVFCSLTCDNETQGPYRLTGSFTTNGYWDPEYLANDLNAPIIPITANQYVTTPRSFPFLPGVYTVAVGDEWGEVNVLHFQVVAKNNYTPSVVLGSFSLCASNCSYYPAPFLTGTIYFNSTSPVESFVMTLTVNGTGAGGAFNGYPIPFTNVPFVYKQTLTSSVMAGDNYTITFQFFFEDNTTAAVSTNVIAQ